MKIIKYKNMILFIVFMFLLGLCGNYEAQGYVDTTNSNKKQEQEIRIQPSVVPEEVITIDTIQIKEKPIQKKVVTEKKKEKQKVDKEQLELLAHLIHAEAEGATYKHKLYVGSVVLNRMKSDYFPDTMEEVIYQKEPLQYACIEDGRIKLEPNDDSYKAARELLEDGSQLPGNVIFQSEFKQGDGVYCQIGNTYFCYKN